MINPAYELLSREYHPAHTGGRLFRRGSRPGRDRGGGDDGQDA